VSRAERALRNPCCDAWRASTAGVASGWWTLSFASPRHSVEQMADQAGERDADRRRQPVEICMALMRQRLLGPPSVGGEVAQLVHGEGAGTHKGDVMMRSCRTPSISHSVGTLLAKHRPVSY
jgi:hypothetical protein